MNWLHKTHRIGPLLYQAVQMEGIVRHNRKCGARHCNPEGAPFLEFSDGRLAQEINGYTQQFHGVRPRYLFSYSRVLQTWF